MSLPPYSPAAIKVRGRFTRVVLHCYVEASEDKLFWKSAMSMFDRDFNVRFYEAGDCKRIDKIIDRIINGDSKKIAIRDSDYLDVLGRLINHPRIFYTFGYSMENSVYNPANLTRAINYLSLTESGNSSTADQWLRQCFNDLKDIVILDIADIKFKKGIGVLGDAGSNYIGHDKDCNLSTSKILTRIGQVVNSFSQEEINEAEELVNKFRKRKYLLIRGHLMTHLVVNFVNREVDRLKPTGKKGKLNHGSIYGHLAGQISATTIDKSELKYIRRKIEEIHRELNSRP